MQAFSGVKYIKIFGVFVNQVYGISQTQQKVVFYSCSLVKLRKFLIYRIKDFTGKKNWVCQYAATPPPPSVMSLLPFPPPPSVMPCPGESQISSIAFCFLLFLDNTFQSNHLDASKTLLGELSQEWTVVTR